MSSSFSFQLKKIVLHGLALVSLIFPTQLFPQIDSGNISDLKFRPLALRVGENFVDPIGFHDSQPVFSWKLPADQGIQSQSAWRISVTNQKPTENQVPERDVLWDSGKVDSSQSVWVPYQGPLLQSRQVVYWRVKFWDDRGRESEWSETARIEMGLLRHDDWQSEWIEPVPKRSRYKSIVLLNAEYGFRSDELTRTKDVTQLVQKALDEGKLPLEVKNDWMGGDPAFLKPKKLWVDFVADGEKKSLNFDENQLFDFDPVYPAHPAYYLRRSFETAGNKKVVKARLYATALGVIQIFLNGAPVGDEVLSPGWTPYSARVESMTWDVTKSVADGKNSIGVVLGEGWYAGNILFRSRSEVKGLIPKLMLQLELTYADGQTETIATNQNWSWTDQGPIRYAGLYYGEDHDRNLDLGDWCGLTPDEKDWQPVKSSSIESKPLIVPKSAPPVRVMQRIPAVASKKTGDGKFIVDFGQNLVGVPCIQVSLKGDEKLTVRFAEMLKKDGSLYTANYRGARSQATLIASREEKIQWRPYLTFFGFRYLEISGLDENCEMPASSFVAEVLHTDFASSGTFHSSHTKLNQLQSNIRWGQIGNFVDIPTDCPQRDERLGWTGDAQVFLMTSFFNYDCYSFWSRWLQSVRDEQLADGAIPHTVPSTPLGFSSPGWADVIVTAPWEIYERTGDIRILEQNYEAMKKWFSVYERNAKENIADLPGFGDWLQPYSRNGHKGETSEELISTAYFGRCAKVLSQVARVLGKSDEEIRFRDLHASIREAFSQRYLAVDSPPKEFDTQTALLIALAFDLVEPELREKTERRLQDLFVKADRHLRTGFLGTPLIVQTFDTIGKPRISYELLFKESYPSWFYPINQGATTMWERWNSYSHSEGFGDAWMNSFNHYAYGAVGQFLYERVAGLKPDAEKPGYKHFFVAPLVDKPLTFANAEIETPYGIARSGWKLEGDRLLIEATVPPNSTATLIFPAGSTEHKRLLDVSRNEIGALGIDIQGLEATSLSPGRHRFEAKLKLSE